MKKRILALMMTSIMLISAVPFSPLSSVISMEVMAGDITELQRVYDSVPPQSEWDKYIDTKVLKNYYDLATTILQQSEVFSQTQIDTATENLRNVLADLKLHTQEIALNMKETTATVGSTVQLSAILTPANAADPVEWRSANDDVATVSSKGLVTIKKYVPQGITILATSNNKSAACKINILNPISGIVISESTAELFEKRKHQLTATITAKDEDANTTDDYEISWSSSNPAIATVSNTGEVTGVSQGTCRITVTAKAKNGGTHTASCDVTVSRFVYISSLEVATELPADGLVITEGETDRTISIKIRPANASLKELEWTSSNEGVAKIGKIKVGDEAISCEIIGVKPGLAKITYKANDGSGKEGSFNVTVKPRITSLKLSDSVKVITLSTKGAKIGATILPADAGNQVLDWSSDNTSVCAVDYDGVLYPGGTGTCVITARTTDGSDITVTCKVRVAAEAKSVTLDKSELTLVNGKNYILKATVTTADKETYNDVVWTSSNENVATVSSTGVVKAYYPGKAIITATAADGSGKKATCAVIVTQPVQGVELPLTSKVSVGGHLTLTPKIIPEYASDNTVTWDSSNEAIATVDENGKVTGVKTGKVIITCKTKDGDFTASCEVTVVIGVNGVTLNKKGLGLQSGETAELKANVSPESATNKAVTWKSSNTNVATVDSAGIVTAKNGGSCIITVTTVDGEYTATCTVSVNQEVSGVEIINPPARLYVGQVYNMTAQVIPETATNQGLSWYTNDSSILRVSTAGQVTAIKAGTAEVWVKTLSGNFVSSAVITVDNKTQVTGVKLDTPQISLLKNEEYLVLAEILPSNASVKDVKWNSSNLNVASVDKDGLIRATGVGNAVITATTVDGGHRAQCKVTVIQPVTGVKLSATDIKLAEGRTTTLTGTVLPTNASNKNLMWFSSDSKIATVDQNGVVKGLESGVTEITVTSVDGGYSASCKVKVYVAVTGVVINATSVSVPRGEKRTVSATVQPANAENTDLIWTSSNETIATVSGSGVITGRTKGTATITVRTEDGNKTDSIIVEVVQLVDKISLDYTSTSLDAGKSKTLTATVSPSTASDKTIKWKSSDSKIVKVNSKGVVTAIKTGTAIITATSNDGNASVTCKITVTQPATGLGISKTKMNVDKGATAALKAEVRPANATSKYVTWTSSDRKVATVDKNGNVKGIKVGKAVITAATANGEFKAKCTVTVINPVTGVNLDKTSLRINVGKTSTLTPTVRPSNASIKSVTWSSSDNDVATVDKDGRVTAEGPGYATITVKTKDNGKTATCRVLVIQPVKSVTLNKSEIKLEHEDTFTLKATVKPSNASNKKVKWSSSNTKVATVSSSGKVTAVGKGTAVITAKSSDGSKLDTCKVTVIKSVTGLKLNVYEKEIYIGKKLTIKASVLPSSASNKTVKWSTSNKKLATVDKNGVVTPLNTGTVKITAKTVDGGFKKVCELTIKRAVTGVKINKSAITLNNGKSYTLKASVLPSNATEKDIEWSSSNAKVAKVNENGKVTATGKGTAVITAESVNGKKITCKVTVKQPVTSVKLSKTEIVVYLGETAKLTASARPTNANDKTLTYKVGNSKILSFSKGKITPKKTGKTKITVTASNGVKAVCTVTVKRHVESVKLNKTSIALFRGKTYSLTATVNPSNATEKGVNFSSSNEAVATVNEKGLVTAIKGGKAVITVTTKENKKTATCTVTVREPVTGIKLDKAEATMFVGASLKLNASILPSNAYNKKLTWASSDAKLATVDANGKVTAKKSGTVTITATTAEGKFKAVCVLTLNQKATGIKLNKTSALLDKGVEHTLVATVLPADAYNKAVKWSTSDPAVATVKNGVVTPLKVGAATITVESEDGGFKAECRVVVKEAVTSVTLNKKEATLHNGETLTLTVSVLPETATNKKVIWSSSDPKVATVENGKITAYTKGVVTITAKSDDGDLKAECKLTVLQNVTHIKTDKDEYVLNEGEKLKIGAYAIPENAENRNLTWKSANEEILKVENGEVTALKSGNTEVTISSVYTKGVSKTVKVTVTKGAAGVALDKTSLELYTKATAALNAVVSPADATNKNVTWKSSNEKVATVKNGIVTAVSRGDAIITVTTEDGKHSAICQVTVIQPVTKITFEKDGYVIPKDSTLEIKATVLPEDANDKSLTWKSSDESVATVKGGVVTPLKVGATIITATDSRGVVSGTVSVTVVSKAEGVVLDKAEATLNVKEKLTLKATVLPEDTTNKEITWASSDSKVATVSGGVVTAVSRGEAVITVTTKDGAKKAECKITVLQPVTSITPEKSELTIEVGKKVTVKCTVLPENANDKALKWSSSNEEVATVLNGEITAKKAGSAVITVTDAAGKIKAEIKITSIIKATGVTLNKTELTIEAGKTETLVASLKPEGATNVNVTWKSSDEKIATVKGGVVSALAKGTALITVTTVDGSFKATCMVTVK